MTDLVEKMTLSIEQFIMVFTKIEGCHEFPLFCFALIKNRIWNDTDVDRSFHQRCKQQMAQNILKCHVLNDGKNKVVEGKKWKKNLRRK